jgi:hypothetical protein
VFLVIVCCSFLLLGKVCSVIYFLFSGNFTSPNQFPFSETLSTC